MDEAVQNSPCGAYVPCAGALSEVSSLLVSMPCQLPAGHDGPHQLHLNTDQFDVQITATER